MGIIRIRLTVLDLNQKTTLKRTDIVQTEQYITRTDMQFL